MWLKDKPNPHRLGLTLSNCVFLVSLSLELFAPQSVCFLVDVIQEHVSVCVRRVAFPFFAPTQSSCVAIVSM